MLSASIIDIDPVMVVCKMKGCRKLSQWPSTFCREHARTQDPPSSEVGLAPAKPLKQPPKTQTGYLGKFLFENEDVIRRVKGIVEEEMSQMTVNTGYRAFTNVQTPINPLLESIVEKAGEVTSFPLKKNRRVQEIVLSVAPPDSSRSNSWTSGLIHRDFKSTEVSGIYTFLLCLDDVTEENGSIKIWKDSKTSEHDRKHPNRAIKGMAAATLLGPKNTVFIWDARLLHKSLPNQSKQSRRVLIWIVSSKTKPGIVPVA